MSRIQITGNSTPIVGVKEFYTVSKVDSVFQNEKQFNTNNAFDQEIKWFLYVLDRGEWRLSKGNEKKGVKTDYTFTQNSLKWKEMKLIVHAYGTKDMIDIKPQRASQGKILHVDLLDGNRNVPTRPFAYGDYIVARVHCVDMELLQVKVSLWEDDGDKHKQNTRNIRIETKQGNVLNGTAYVSFYLDPSHAWLADAKLAKGDKDEGKFHEYYVTAEIFEKISKRSASKNANVANPAYNYEPPVSKEPTPAEQKGPSKKEDKGLITSEKKVHDYHEQKVTVKKEIWKNPFVEQLNSYLMVWDSSSNPKKDSCACKEYDLIWGNKVSCEFRKKVVEICTSLWPDKYKSMANGLMAGMRVETSETFSPSKIDLINYFDSNGKQRKKYAGLSKEAVNKLDDNFNGAVGLIQFTKDAIDALNRENSLKLTKKKLALMSDLEQLDYVKMYFMLYDWYKKILSPEDIYLQVFAPVGIAKEEDYVLYKKHENPQTAKEKTSTKNYNANKSVDEENNNDKKIQRSEILGRYRTSYSEGLSKKEKDFSCGTLKEKEESENIGVLDDMKNLVDKHIPYTQLGIRNSLSEKGLTGLDCSETVSIYLTKLGITASVKDIHTGLMTTEKDFRKAIDSVNIDFVLGSDSEYFKPQRGDIFVWRKSNGIGHTGIVYEFNEKSDLITILEAIGEVGSADEMTNINNGGYSGKGSSRTAVYKRTGKALASHKGWKGYFRPKNYTKKL